MNNFTTNQEEVNRINSKASATGVTWISDILLERYGMVGANVFGVIQRHCEVGGGFCYARQEDLGSMIGVTRATVNRWIKILCEDGYLVDRTPYYFSRPHVYEDTGKIGYRVQLSEAAS